MGLGGSFGCYERQKRKDPRKRVIDFPEFHARNVARLALLPQGCGPALVVGRGTSHYPVVAPLGQSIPLI